MDNTMTRYTSLLVLHQAARDVQVHGLAGQQGRPGLALGVNRLAVNLKHSAACSLELHTLEVAVAFDAFLQQKNGQHKTRLVKWQAHNMM